MHQYGFKLCVQIVGDAHVSSQMKNTWFLYFPHSVVIFKVCQEHFEKLGMQL
jgi:hypothetical protein